MVVQKDPAYVSGTDATLTGIVAVAAGAHHVLALDQNGQVWGWGQNTHGELGLGDTNNRPLAVQIPIPATIVAIGVGFYPSGTVHVDYGTSFAITNDGTIYAWGRDEYGQLGFSGSAAILTPTVTASTIKLANQPPAASISLSPASGPYIAPMNLVLTGSGNDPDGSVARIDLFSGSAPLGGGYTNPYSQSYSNLLSGTYTLTAVSTDDVGATGSASQVVTVVPPTVSLTANSTGTSFEFARNYSGTTPGGAVSVQYSTSGDAIAGVDYTALSGTAVVPSGAGSVDVPIAILSPLQPRTLTLSISPGSSYVGSGSASLLLSATTLTSWLKMDDGAGTTLADSSGSNHPGSFLGESTGTWGSSFDGSGDVVLDGTSYIDCGAGLFAPNQPFSVFLWFKCNQLQDANWNELVFNGAYFWGPSGFELSVIGANDYYEWDPRVNPYIGFRTNVTGGAISNESVVTPDVAHRIDLGVWYNVVVTNDGNGVTTMYLNGLQVAQDNRPGTATVVLDSANHTYIGGPDSTNKFNGEIDDFRIYNRVLSSAEVATIGSLFPGSIPAVSITKISDAYYNANGMAVSGTFRLTRSGALPDMNVVYSATGSAVSGYNYLALSGTAHFVEGASSVDVPVYPLFTGSTSLTCTVLSGSSYSTVSGSASASMDIGGPAWNDSVSVAVPQNGRALVGLQQIGPPDAASYVIIAPDVPGLDPNNVLSIGAPGTEMYAMSKDLLASKGYFKLQHGVLRGVGAQYVYTPEPSFTGTDSFQYYVQYDATTTGTVSVVLTVSGTDSTAVYPNYQFTSVVNQGESIDIPLSVSNPNGHSYTCVFESMPYMGVSDTTGAVGVFSGTSVPILHYTAPSDGVSHEDAVTYPSFTYHLVDQTVAGTGTSVSMTAYINVVRPLYITSDSNAVYGDGSDASQPLDASTPDKYEQIIVTNTSYVAFHYAPGVYQCWGKHALSYSSYQPRNGVISYADTAYTGCKHYGDTAQSGTLTTTLKMVYTGTGDADNVIFGVSPNDGDDKPGFEVHDMILDCGFDNMPSRSAGAISISPANNILIQNCVIKNYGQPLNSAGEEFVLYICGVAKAVGYPVRNIFADHCTMTSPGHDSSGFSTSSFPDTSDYNEPVSNTGILKSSWLDAGPSDQIVHGPQAQLVKDCYIRGSTTAANYHEPGSDLLVPDVSGTFDGNITENVYCGVYLNWHYGATVGGEYLRDNIYISGTSGGGLFNTYFDGNYGANPVYESTGLGQLTLKGNVIRTASGKLGDSTAGEGVFLGEVGVKDVLYSYNGQQLPTQSIYSLSARNNVIALGAGRDLMIYTPPTVSSWIANPTDSDKQNPEVQKEYSAIQALYNNVDSYGRSTQITNFINHNAVWIPNWTVQQPYPGQP